MRLSRQLLRELSRPVALNSGYKEKTGGPNGFRMNGTGMPRRSNGEQVFRSAFVWTGIYGECCQGNMYYTAPDGGGALNGQWFLGGWPYPFSPTYITAYGINANWPGASSLHPGGLNVLLADGSARFATETMSWPTWAMINGIHDKYTTTGF